MSVKHYSPVSAKSNEQGALYGSGMDLAMEASSAQAPWKNSRKKMMSAHGRIRIGQMMVVELINSTNNQVRKLGYMLESQGLSLPKKVQVYKKNTAIIARFINHKGGSTHFTCFGLKGSTLQNWKGPIC